MADVDIDENISAEDVKLTTVLEARMTKPNGVISKMKIKIGKFIQIDGAKIRHGRCGVLEVLGERCCSR